MASVVMLPSGRFRGFAQVRQMRDNQTFDRKDQAQVWAEKTEARMRAGTWTKTERVSKAAEVLTLTKLCQQYVQSEEWLSKAQTTRKAESLKHKHVLRLLGTKPVVDLTPDDVRNYVALRRQEAPARITARSGSTVKAHTVRLEVAALSALCNYAVEPLGILSTNPTQGVKRPRGDRRMARIDDETLGKILEHPAIFNDEKAYLFYRILFASLCRPGELAGAMRSWLRHDFPQIHVPRTKNEDERVILLPRRIHVQLVEWLATQPADCPYIFGTKKLQRPGYSPYNYAVPWRKVRKDLGLTAREIVSYTARHEGISRLFEQTQLSDGQIAGLSGHRSSQALWHYKHLRNEHQRPTIESLDMVVTNAIDRAITGAHPSQPLGPGQLLTDVVKPGQKPRRRARGTAAGQ